MFMLNRMLGFALLSPTYDFASSEVLSTFKSKRLLVENQAKDGRSGVSNLRPCHGCEHTGDAAITDDRTAFSKVRPGWPFWCLRATHPTRRDENQRSSIHGGMH